MATIKQHKRQREHNLALISYLQTSDDGYLDWQITAYFYAALHQVHVTLHALSVAIPLKARHDIIQQLVAKHIPHAASDYKLLLALSHKSRYRPQYTITMYHTTLAERYYKAIEDACNDRLNS